MKKFYWIGAPENHIYAMKTCKIDGEREGEWIWPFLQFWCNPKLPYALRCERNENALLPIEGTICEYNIWMRVGIF